MSRCSLALIVAALALTAGAATAQEIAITFDDLPAHSALPPGETRVGVAVRILDALKAAGAAPAYGFINGVQTEREPDSTAVLDLWTSAGHPLGNHSWSHINLADHDAAAFAADVTRNEALLKARSGGADWRWFRYPFLSEGDTPAKRDAVRGFLRAGGYRVASVTLSFDDYAWNEPYARCVTQGDTAAIAGLESSFLAAAKASLDYSRGLSRSLYGRDIPYVLLMHAGAFDARMMPQLLALYRAEGASLVTLEAAQSDPFYRTDVEALGAPAATLENAAAARGIKPPVRGWDPAALSKVCRSKS
jgi:peptidoglycan/xylan/chitin deacetylase (PgdA/CDA1 family)